MAKCATQGDNGGVRQCERRRLRSRRRVMIAAHQSTTGSHRSCRSEHGPGSQANGMKPSWFCSDRVPVLAVGHRSDPGQPLEVAIRPLDRVLGDEPFRGQHRLLRANRQDGEGRYHVRQEATSAVGIVEQRQRPCILQRHRNGSRRSCRPLCSLPPSRAAARGRNATGSADRW